MNETDGMSMRLNAGPTSRTVSGKSLREIAEFLWDLLDDIDTADDLAKGNDALYRNLVRKAHQRRFEVGTTDGYWLFLDSDDAAVPSTGEG